MHNIVVGITGCIAAYKSIELVRQLINIGFSVKVILTQHALHFVNPLPLRILSKNKVFMDMFDSKADDWVPHHIALADWADLLAIIPASANTLSKLANGMADNLLCTTFLAFEGPVLVGASMNDKMWRHPSFVAQRNRLTALPNLSILEPETGTLACGSYGKGRLVDIPVMIDAITQTLAKDKT